MGIWFEIEGTTLVRGRAYVTARILEPQGFSLCGQHTLGGYPIEPWIGRPRSRGGDGELRSDLFSFVLRDAAGLEEMKSGRRVALSRQSCELDR
jgi:hypothetical protein